MQAIDTNIVVRFLTNDDKDQSRRARKVLLDGDIFLSLTVCLECEWVLRGVYRFTKPEIAAKLIEVAGLPGISVEDPETLEQAVAGLRAGMDFADALHLACAQNSTAMLSFDTDFAKRANQLGTIPVLEP